MFTLTFWKDAAERAVTTAAEVTLGFIVVGTTALNEIDFMHVGAVAGAAACASVLKSLIASRIGDGSASLVPAKPTVG